MIPFMVLAPDENPALDLSAIQNIVMVLDYRYEKA